MPNFSFQYMHLKYFFISKITIFMKSAHKKQIFLIKSPRNNLKLIHGDFNYIFVELDFPDDITYFLIFTATGFE